MEYSKMNVQQRAEYLLTKGVEAQLGIDPVALAPGYAAHAIGVGKLPCGYHGNEQAAIDAGTAWLREKASPPLPFNVMSIAIPANDTGHCELSWTSDPPKNGLQSTLQADTLDIYGSTSVMY